MAENTPRIFQDEEQPDGTFVRWIPARYRDGSYHLHKRVRGTTSNRAVNIVPAWSEDELIERLLTGRYRLRVERQDNGSPAPSLRAPQRFNIPEAGQVQRNGNERLAAVIRGANRMTDEGAYLPDGIDRRPQAQRLVRARQGQHRFKMKLIDRYGAACMISGCQVFEVIEAAHILQYLGEKDNHRENGLLLRSDLHALFDSDLIGIEPETLVVHLNPELQESEYWVYQRAQLRCGEQRPSHAALLEKWRYYQDRLNVRD